MLKDARFVPGGKPNN